MNLAFCFGEPDARIAQDDGYAIHLGNAVIDGNSRQEIAVSLPGPQKSGNVLLWRCAKTLWGAAVVDVQGQPMEDAARALYSEILGGLDGRSLYRVWNFIPHINEIRDGLEVYQAFCKGRAVAFDRHFASAVESRMPAASAVGTPGDRVCIAFIAGAEPVAYVENPQQISAYRYPPRYGPKSPSFARASVVTGDSGTRLYVSGTASIRGSESVHPDDVSAQCELVMENLNLVARSAGLSDGLDAASPGRRRFRAYLRDPAHWPKIRHAVERGLLRGGDCFTAVQAEICRRELLVEIEARVDLP